MPLFLTKFILHATIESFSFVRRQSLSLARGIEIVEEKEEKKKMMMVSVLLSIFPKFSAKLAKIVQHEPIAAKFSVFSVGIFRSHQRRVGRCSSVHF